MSAHIRSPDLSARGFDYVAAFSRNIGWVTEWEQQELRRKTVAIAGLGGVGGAHALTLARLGIGGFHLADLDRFDIVNFNRQSGAFVSTLGQEKTAVTARMLRDVNPQLRLKVFERGISDSNLDEFLTGVDLFVDGLDFFELNIRRAVFKRCAERRISAITAAPIGFGSSCLIFVPGGMTFESYFRFEGLSQEKQYVNFALGLTPRGFHRHYLADPSRLDLAHHRGPSTAAAIQLCAGIVAAEATKLLLGRGKIHAAPWYQQFDAYSGRWKRGKLYFGNAGPLQSLKRLVGYRAFSGLSRNARPDDPPVGSAELEQILGLARWAPSGDNAQPWRFQITGDDTITARVHVEGEERNIYDYANGQPTLLSGGCLLESIRIAASRFGRRVEWNYRGAGKSQSGGTDHLIELLLTKDDSVREDELCAYLPIRSVDRHAYSLRPLGVADRRELESVLGENLTIEWRQSFRQRWRLAKLCARATKIRLNLPEAYRVHRSILDWKRRFSPDGVPATAVGLDALTLPLMRWVMQSWSRVQVMNRYLGGTVIPRIELDLVPGMSCAAFFVVRRNPDNGNGHSPVALLETGQLLQRFWLVATRMGLAMQPTLAPLCFAHYGRTDRANDLFGKFAGAAESCIPGAVSVLFLGRIGFPNRVRQTTRSIRRNIGDLMA